MATPSPVEDGHFFGYKDIAFLCASTVTGLFPRAVEEDEAESPSDSSHTKAHRDEDPVEELAEWVAYFLYRTILRQETVFHALHILLRLAASSAPLPEVFEAQPTEASSPPNLMHYRLLLAAFILCTAYSMDDCYSNRSFAIAARFLFPLAEINKLELELLRALDWRLSAEGEKLDEVVGRYIDDFEQGLAEREEQRLEEKEALRLREVAVRREAKMRAIFGPDVVNASMRHPDDGRDLRRLAKVHQLLGQEVGILYPRTPTQFAFLVQEEGGIGDIPSSSDEDEEEEIVSPLPHPPSRPPECKARQRKISNGERLRPSPAMSWRGFSLSPREPSVADNDVVVYGTPAPAPATARDACQCALQQATNGKANPATPCKWCLIQRAKARFAHSRPFEFLHSTRPPRFLSALS